MVSWPILSFIGLSSWYWSDPAASANITASAKKKDNIGLITIHDLYDRFHALMIMLFVSIKNNIGLLIIQDLCDIFHALIIILFVSGKAPKGSLRECAQSLCSNDLTSANYKGNCFIKNCTQGLKIKKHDKLYRILHKIPAFWTTYHTKKYRLHGSIPSAVTCNNVMSSLCEPHIQ